MRHVLLGAILVCAAALAAAAWTSGPAHAAPGDEETPGSVEQWFTVFTGTQRTGYACRKVTKAFDTVILEEKFLAVIKEKAARFESVVVYRTSKPVGPTDGKLTTYLGETRLMEGTVAFAKAEAGGGRVAHVEMAGYADRTLRILDPAPKKTIDMPVPDGLVIVQPALLYLAPRLLPKEGRLDGLVYAKFPADIDFPGLVSFKPDFVLERAKPDDAGNSEIVLKAQQKTTAGTNITTVAKVTVDAKGETVEYTWGGFTLRPSTQDEALRPPGAAPAPPAPPAKK